MAEDFVQSFQLDSVNMRGRIVKFQNVLDQIISQHNYPNWVGFQLAEALLINAAMAASLKLQGKLSLQIQSEGAIKLIATDYFSAQDGGEPTLRGYVKYDQSLKDAGVEDLTKGIFGIIIDQGGGVAPYQGMTELKPSLTKSAISYFNNSEQIPTMFHVDVVHDSLNDKWLGGLIMMQQIAATGGHSSVENSQEDFMRIEALLGTLTREELLLEDVSSESLIYRLFHEDDPTANPIQKLEFGCPCSEEKVRQSLSIYSRKELEHMISDEGVITADCQFCSTHYTLDPDKLGNQNT